jgi:DNA-binding transcriptional MerR regulator
MNSRYLLNEVAKMLGVRTHRIIYAITQGMVQEPAERFNRSRVFTDTDVQRLREYFRSRRGKKKEKGVEMP